VKILQTLGEHAMMDFGLQGLLDRIERDFGNRVAKALTLLVALAIVAGCLTLVGNLISAFSVWISGITSESTLWAKLLYIGKYLIGLGLLVILANNFASLVTVKNLHSMALNNMLSTDDLIKRATDGDLALDNNVRILADIVKEMAEMNEGEPATSQLCALHAKILGATKGEGEGQATEPHQKTPARL